MKLKRVSTLIERYLTNQSYQNVFKVSGYIFRESNYAIFTFSSLLNPIALRKAKTLLSFGCSECSRVKEANSSLIKGIPIEEGGLKIRHILFS